MQNFPQRARKSLGTAGLTFFVDDKNGFFLTFGSQIKPTGSTFFMLAPTFCQTG